MTSYQPPRRSWLKKFADAFLGLAQGVRGQGSFVVHFVCATLVVAAGFLFRVEVVEWQSLVLCITLVLAAELFNSALEQLAKAVDRRESPQLAVALNIASAAVLVAALGAVVVGSLVFLPKILRVWGVWS